MTIQGNTFTGNYYGIDASSTVPLSGLVQQINSNVFQNNTIGVNANNINELKVQNNTFNNNSIGVRINGQSKFKIKGNDFMGSFFGISLSQSGNLANDISCNTHADTYGVYANGNNLGVKFKNQDFATNSGDIILVNQGTSPGVFSHQGSFSAAHWNYFSSAHSGHIQTFGATNIFYYFHPNSSTNTRLKPKCSLNFPTSCSGSPNNFYTIQAAGGSDECNTVGLLSDCENKDCLFSIQEQINSFELIEDDVQNRNQYENLLLEESKVLQKLVGERIQQKDYKTAIDLLKSSKDVSFNKNIFGVLLLQYDYNGAQTFLNNFAINSASDLDFITVQQIKLNCLKSSIFELSEEEDKTLNTIAMSDSPNASYAKSLLTFITGKTFAPELLEMKDYLYANNQMYFEGAELNVYPNPTKGSLSIEIDAEVEQITLIDLNGRQVLQTSNLKMDIKHLANGIYLLKVRTKDKVLLKKIVKQ